MNELLLIHERDTHLACSSTFCQSFCCLSKPLYAADQMQQRQSIRNYPKGSPPVAPLTLAQIVLL